MITLQHSVWAFLAFLNNFCRILDAITSMLKSKHFEDFLATFLPPSPFSFSLPDPSLVQILRYKDANAGWRSIPQLNGAGDDKVVISATAVFHIDTTSNSVFAEENSAKLPLGRQIVYRVM